MVAMVVVGSGSTDPQKFTKDYCGLFTDSGVMPKRHLGRFPVTSNAVSSHYYRIILSTIFEIYFLLRYFNPGLR